MKESCLPRAGPCLLPDSCTAARLFWERMRPTSSMHSRWQHKIGSTKSFRSVCHLGTGSGKIGSRKWYDVRITRWTADSRQWTVDGTGKPPGQGTRSGRLFIQCNATT